MKKYVFLVYHKQYNDFLNKLQEVGVLHVTERQHDSESNELCEKMQLAEAIEKRLKVAESLLIPTATPLDATTCDANELIHAFDELLNEKTRIEKSIEQNQREAERMQVWGNFDNAKLDALKQSGYIVQFFACNAKSFDPAWETQFNACTIDQIGSTLYFATVNHETIQLEAEEIKLNEHNAQQLQVDCEAMRHLLVAQQGKIEAWVIANINNLRQLHTDIEQNINLQKVRLNTLAEADEKVMLLEGFCPIDNESALNAMLENEGVYYQVSEPQETDDVPIKLHNNWFTRMFECLTGMYGWPVYGEFDPTPILGPFFLLFFALCMGDSGYGLILIIAGWLIAKGKLKIAMFEGLGPIIATLGVGTLVIGFFLGTAFGVDLYAASWMPASLKAVMIKGSVAGYDIQMVMALGIGVVHICLAMCVKAICYTKRFGLKSQFATWGWLLLILGGLTIAVLALTSVFSPEVTKIALIAVGTISALGIYIFNTPGRNPLINIGAGLWDTYNMATGILGDVLSYIRLYALGLAGGMLGAAFNNLGNMVLGDTPNIGSWIGFIAILLIGHVLNLLMSALGAFVHPLRLSFVEYFKNSGYEGKGTIYQPFK